MSRAQRLAMLGIAVVVAVAAFVLLRPSEEPRESARQTGTPSGGGGGSGSTPEAEPRPAPKPAYQLISVEDGKPVGGVQDIDVDSGDTVRLAFRVDREDEVHIHGYDRLVEVGPGRTAKARFSADLEGVFEVELHSDSTEIASLRVNP